MPVAIPPAIVLHLNAAKRGHDMGKSARTNIVSWIPNIWMGRFPLAWACQRTAVFKLLWDLTWPFQLLTLPDLWSKGPDFQWRRGPGLAALSARASGLYPDFGLRAGRLLRLTLGRLGTGSL